MNCYVFEVTFNDNVYTILYIIHFVYFVMTRFLKIVPIHYILTCNACDVNVVFAFKMLVQFMDWFILKPQCILRSQGN